MTYCPLGLLLWETCCLGPYEFHVRLKILQEDDAKYSPDCPCRYCCDDACEAKEGVLRLQRSVERSWHSGVDVLRFRSLRDVLEELRNDREEIERTELKLLKLLPSPKFGKNATATPLLA